MIDENQIKAAALYWVKVIKQEIKPQQQSQPSQRTPFITVLSKRNREGLLLKLEEHQSLLEQFTTELDSLTQGKDEDSITLYLNVEPEGLLSELTQKLKIHTGFFPRVEILMKFDQKGNLLINEETINAKEFLASHHSLPSCQPISPT